MTTGRGRRRVLVEDLHRMDRRSSQAMARLTRVADQVKRMEGQCAVERHRIERLETELLPPADRRSRKALVSGSDIEVDPGFASFSEALRWHRRNRAQRVWDDEGLVEPVLLFNCKLAGRDFAAAHGVPVAAEYGRWPTPEDIQWDGLPEGFVIKSTHGLGSYGVFPLRATDGGGYLDGITQRVLTREQVVTALRRRHTDESRYFAEEYLTDLSDTERMPHDVKVFCCYGTVVYLEVRRDVWNRLGSAGQARVRSFLPDGTELHTPRPFMTGGIDLPPPQDLPAIVEAASRLSSHIRRPFIRIDFYETDRGVIFGEFGKNPQHTPALVPDLDLRFGQVYEEAFARMLSDVAAEGPFRAPTAPSMEAAAC